MSDNVTLILVLVLVLAFMAGIAAVVIIFLKYSHRSYHMEMRPPEPPEEERVPVQYRIEHAED